LENESNSSGGNSIVENNNRADESFRDLKQTASKFFVLAEADIQKNRDIRRVSYRNSLRQDLEKKLLIKPKQFNILEQFTKPWYPTNEKDRRHRLGVYHRATLTDDVKNVTRKVLCR
jgi:hypothetical protein